MITTDAQLEVDDILMSRIFSTYVYEDNDGELSWSGQIVSTFTLDEQDQLQLGQTMKIGRQNSVRLFLQDGRNAKIFLEPGNYRSASYGVVYRWEFKHCA